MKYELHPVTNVKVNVHKFLLTGIGPFSMSKNDKAPNRKSVTKPQINHNMRRVISFL